MSHTAFDFICLVNRFSYISFTRACEQYNAALRAVMQHQEEHAVEYAQYGKALENLKGYIQKCVDTPGFIPAYAEYRRRKNLVRLNPNDIAEFIVDFGSQLPAPEELAFTAAQSYLEYKKRYAEAKQIYLLMPKEPLRPKLPEFPYEPYIIYSTADLYEALIALSSEWEELCDYAYNQYWSERELRYDEDSGKLFVHLSDLQVALTEED